MMKYLLGRSVVIALLAVVVSIGGLRAEEEEGDEGALTISDYEQRITDDDRGHWAFQPARKPAVPTVKQNDWVRNPIDAFVLAGLEEKGWQPATSAQPHQLLRRAYLDLIGLPPTIAEQDAFLADPSAKNYLKTIDDLLARKGYGERWGRHWLDLVRFAETNGYERDGTKPHVWRFRDYVIRSFNDDKPFDRFALEQLAGDELEPVTGETLIATGYYRLGPWDDEPADPATDRYDQLDDIISTTSQVFLGLTMGCARCHDHKFEPLTTLDYYRLLAIFDPLKRPQNGRTELDLPAGSDVEKQRIVERDAKIRELEKPIQQLRGDFRAKFLKSGNSKIPPEALTALQTPADKRTAEQKKLADQHAKQLAEEIAAALPEAAKKQIAAHHEAVAELRRVTPDLPRGYFLHEPQPNPPKTFILLRGKPGSHGMQVGPALPVVLAAHREPFSEPSPKTTRRRLALASWIASPDNPLTSRVIVNRVWQFHFGEGIVRTPSDFGVMGEAPTHPELLDWLAVWLVEHDWSLKKLHKLIMSSNTYRMSKRSREDYATADPTNELLWKFPYRRLEVEAIRDSVLSASGRLSRKMYGPSMYPFVPKQAMEGHSDPGKIWPPFNEDEASRRTVYAFVKRSMIVPLLEVLDLCDTTRTSAQRQITSVAPQALTLYNGNFINRQARHLAERLQREAGDDRTAQIKHAYRLTLCRPPTDAEIQAMSAYLTAQTAAFEREAKTPKRDEAQTEALVQLCRVIFNLNEFAYAD